MGTRTHTVSITSTDPGAIGTGYTAYISGFIESIQYVKVDYANGVDFTITAEATGETIWTEQNVNAATIRYPRAATHTVLGVGALYVAGAAVLNRIALGRDRVKIAIAQAGAAKAGSFVVTVSD